MWVVRAERTQCRTVGQAQCTQSVRCVATAPANAARATHATTQKTVSTTTKRRRWRRRKRKRKKRTTTDWTAVRAGPSSVASTVTCAQPLCAVCGCLCYAPCSAVLCVLCCGRHDGETTKNRYGNTRGGEGR